MFYKLTYKGWQDAFYYVLVTLKTNSYIEGRFVVSDKYKIFDEYVPNAKGLWNLKELEYCDEVTDQETITRLEKLFNPEKVEKAKKMKYTIRDMSRAIVIEGQIPLGSEKDQWICEIVYEKDNLPTQYSDFNRHNTANNCLVRTNKGALIFILKSQLDPIIEEIKINHENHNITVLPGVKVVVNSRVIDKPTVEKIIKAWNNVS